MSRISIYQLFVRHFSNTEKGQVDNGSLEENGCGTFNGISEKALHEISALGFSHVWLTGVIEHASLTSYPERPAHPEGIVKGRAGSPYAISDYYDVCPDFVESFENRIEEFESLVQRTHKAGLKCLIDFVPNHVARTYASDVRPEIDFGADDDKSVFFGRENSFYYLEGEGELVLPEGRGTFSPEENAGRVTGNNSITWHPSPHDWYETVKLNYGYDFRDRNSLWSLPSNETALEDVPQTWQKMLDILLYWAEKGVDGVRCDMAHMVPVQFWAWATKQVRLRFPHFLFLAEAYADDPMGCLPHRSLNDLSNAGFDGYYDQDLYHALKAVTEEHQSTQSLDFVFFNQDSQTHGVRYIENHDEVRSANAAHFGTVFQNLAACATAWLTGSGPVMLYSGQEVGEPAVGATGYSDDNARSSIFDYTHLPKLQQWVNGGKYNNDGLEGWQILLREGYRRLLSLAMIEPFVSGEAYGLNYANEVFSPLGIHAFLRFNRGSDAEVSICVTCFAKSPPEVVSVMVPKAALEHIGLSVDAELQGDYERLSNGGVVIRVPLELGFGVEGVIPTN